MNEKYYPWGGDFTVCNPKGNIAVVLLNIDYTPVQNVAIYGKLKTENIGIEKIVANVISNPHIRYLLICGGEIRGHKSGNSLLALYNNGIDDQNKIIDAPGAIPYIENLDKNAIKRFQDQLEIVNLIGIIDSNEIKMAINNYIDKPANSFGEPYIAIKIKLKIVTVLDDKRVIHSKIVIDYMGKIKKRG